MPGLGQNELLSMSQQFSGLPMDSLIGGPLNAAASANGTMAANQVKFMLDTCFTKIVVPAAAGTAATAGTPGSPAVPAVIDSTTGLVTTAAVPSVPAINPTPAVPGVSEYTNYAPIMINMSLTRQVITPVGDSVSKAYVLSVEAYNKSMASGQNATPPSEPKANIQNITTAFNLPLLTIIPLNSLAVQTVNINFEMEVKSSYGEDHSNESSKSMAAEASFEAKINYGIFSASVKGSASTKSEDKTSESSHYEKSNTAKYTVGVTAGQIPLPEGVKTIIDAFAGAIVPVTMPVPA